MVSRQGTRAAKGREAEKKEKDLAFAVLVGKVSLGEIFRASWFLDTVSDM